MLRKGMEAFSTYNKGFSSRATESIRESKGFSARAMGISREISDWSRGRAQNTREQLGLDEE